MGERRLFDRMTERMALGRRFRILRHRTARWFTPPVRQTVEGPLDEVPRLRLLTTLPSARRSGPTMH